MTQDKVATLRLRKDELRFLLCVLTGTKVPSWINGEIVHQQLLAQLAGAMENAQGIERGLARGGKLREPDVHGNMIALEGNTRCACGCKYWEDDRCVDCASPPPPEFSALPALEQAEIIASRADARRS